MTNASTANSLSLECTLEKSIIKLNDDTSSSVDQSDLLNGNFLDNPNVTCTLLHRIAFTVWHTALHIECSEVCVSTRFAHLCFFLQPLLSTFTMTFNT